MAVSWPRLDSISNTWPISTPPSQIRPKKEKKKKQTNSRCRKKSKKKKESKAKSMASFSINCLANPQAKPRRPITIRGNPPTFVSAPGRRIVAGEPKKKKKTLIFPFFFSLKLFILVVYDHKIMPRWKFVLD